MEQRIEASADRFDPRQRGEDRNDRPENPALRAREAPLPAQRRRFQSRFRMGRSAPSPRSACASNRLFLFSRDDGPVRDRPRSPALPFRDPRKLDCAGISPITPARGPHDHCIRCMSRRLLWLPLDGFLRFFLWLRGVAAPLRSEVGQTSFAFRHDMGRICEPAAGGLTGMGGGRTGRGMGGFGHEQVFAGVAVGGQCRARTMPSAVVASRGRDWRTATAPPARWAACCAAPPPMRSPAAGIPARASHRRRSCGAS